MSKLINFRKSQYEAFIKETEAQTGPLTSILTQYNQLGMSELNSQEFRALLLSPESTIYSKLTEKQGSRMQLDEKEGYKIIRKPSGTVELVKLINDMMRGGPDWAKRIVPENYEIESGVIIMDKAVRASLQSKYEVYTQNENQEKAFECLQRLESVLNEFNSLYGGRIGTIQDFKNVFDKPSHLGPFVAKGECVLKLD